MSDDKGNEAYSGSVWAFIKLAPDDEPFIVTAEFDKETVAYGETVTTTFRIKGGSPPYTIEDAHWSVGYENGYFSDDYPVEGQFHNEDTVSIKPMPVIAGELVFAYRAKDAVGRNFYSVTRVPVHGPHGPPALKGDANDDKTINVKDLLAIINYIVIHTECPSMENADTNDDGSVEVDDLIFVFDEIVPR